MSDNYPVDKAIERLEERVYREEKTRYSQHQSLENRIKTLEERLPKIEALEQAHAELAAKVEELRTLMNARYNAQAAMIVNIKDRASLESPAPAPDPVCTCGKTKSAHGYGCLKFESAEERWVDTTVPTAEPEPAPLDPGFRIAIREAVVRMAALNVTVQEVDDITDAVIHTIRTYGRDGAR